MTAPSGTAATTSATAQFRPVEHSLLTDTHAALLIARSDDRVMVRASSECVRLSTVDCETDTAATASLLPAEAIATGRELLKAAGAPAEAADLRKQRDELLSALREIKALPAHPMRNKASTIAALAIDRVEAQQ